jgi:hypothetical protein
VVFPKTLLWAGTFKEAATRHRDNAAGKSLLLSIAGFYQCTLILHTSSTPRREFPKRDSVEEGDLPKNILSHFANRRW